jgi:hypothetical protein
MSAEKGLPVAGVPRGPEIEERTQEEQPGIQAEMKVQPEESKVPTPLHGRKIFDGTCSSRAATRVRAPAALFRAR